MGDPEGSREKEIRAADQMAHLHLRERRKEDTHAPIHGVSTFRVTPFWIGISQDSQPPGMAYSTVFPFPAPLCYLASRVSFETRFDSKN
jgi:hypothetical protein